MRVEVEAFILFVLSGVGRGHAHVVDIRVSLFSSLRVAEKCEWGALAGQGGEPGYEARTHRVLLVA